MVMAVRTMEVEQGERTEILWRRRAHPKFEIRTSSLAFDGRCHSPPA
jgi:hypothetical protein